MRMRTRRTMDVGRIAEALKTKGIDLRHWSSHGTVGTVDDAGNEDFTNNHAVIVAPDGVWADVILQPLNIPVTARVSFGVGGPACSILAPIRPGDEVLVIIPDGDLSNPPAIVAVLNSEGVKIPLGDDSKPVFQNDRLSVYAKDVPVEVRTASGAKVRLEVDGTISLVPADGKTVFAGGTSDTEAAALGDTIQSFMSQMKNWLDTHTHLVPGALGGGPGLTTNVPAPLSPSPPDVTSSNVQVKK